MQSCLIKMHSMSTSSIGTPVCLQQEGVMLCEPQGWATGRAKARVRSYLGPVPIPKLGHGFTRGLRLNQNTVLFYVAARASTKVSLGG